MFKLFLLDALHLILTGSRVKPLFSYFIDLCLLRAGPQDLPATGMLFWLLLPLSLTVSALLVSVDVGGLDRGFVAALLDLVLMLSWVWLLLSFKRHGPRFLQTSTAMLGCGALLGTLGLPLQMAAATGGIHLAALGLFFVLFWSLVVIAHILRHALEVGMGLAMGLALTYSVIISLVINFFFPGTGGG
ncbi:MAG: hypothetical protein KJ558_15205 [Gammaproteobacteria bacterium]|nr:hypothetical protein [Gammaproteobacteria bacterium]MBU1656135.1 hypothetical protein [Gammaproteobacteria bacterium]MBU1960164.1 hypothetical protein [Gammaproteobacteria bacterium]